MALYDYQCEKCMAHFEEICPMDEADEPKKCPCCGEMSPRVFAPTKHFVLKGWGWSNDGYDGVSKESWKQRNVFNRDGTLKSQHGDKNDWGDQKHHDLKAGKKKEKPGRKKVAV